MITERKNDLNNNRIIYFDILRAAASFCVVMTHVAQQVWYSCPVSTSEWEIANGYESAVRWAVPVFVMISGTLFLNSKQSFAHIAQNNLIKIIKVLMSWGGVYFLEGMLLQKGLNASVVSVLYGPLWFLFMLAGLYMIIPFLRKFVNDDKLVIYFLLLNILSTFLVPSLSNAAGFFSHSAKKAIDLIAENSFFYFPMGYTGYFVLGYWLNKNVIKKKYKVSIYILGLLSFIVLPVMTSIRSRQLGTVHDFYGNLSLGILLESIVLFIIAKDKTKYLNTTLIKICQTISRHSLGVYLIHKIIIDLFNEVLHVRWDFGSVFISIPLLSVCIFIISVLLTVVLSKMPFIKRLV